jgi:hypothetical protein
MVVVNTLATPPVLVFLFRSPESGLKKTAKSLIKIETPLMFDFPSREMAELFADKLCEVFVSKGFFVHTLDDQVHEVRKDTVVIDFECRGAVLEVDVKPDDIPLMKSAMQEATAALEKTVQALKATDISKIGNRFMEYFH